MVLKFLQILLMCYIF